MFQTLVEIGTANVGRYNVKLKWKHELKKRFLSRITPITQSTVILCTIYMKIYVYL